MKLLVIAHGSMQNILSRNALKRLQLVALDGFFHQVDYVFYRNPVSAMYQIAPGFRVHEVSGLSARWQEAPAVVRRLAALYGGYREISKICRKSRPDIVACVEPFIPGAIALLTARRYAAPLVVHLVADYQLLYRVAHFNQTFLPPALSFAVERFVLSQADMIMTDRDYYRQYAIRRGARPDRVKTTPMYVDPAFHNPSPSATIWERLGIPDVSPLVFVGRLSREKSVADLVDCLGELRALLPSTHLVLVGDGPQRQELFDRAQHLNLLHRIHVRTGLAPGDIAAAYALAGAVLVTHGGYSLLEACFSSAPIIAYNYEWHPEMIVDGETGCLVPYRDVSAMAKAALTLVKDRALAVRLGAAARKRALDRHPQEMVIPAQVECYQWLFAHSTKSLR